MRRLFSFLTGRSKSPEDTDPRWAALAAETATCPCCGEPCSAVLSFSFRHPDICPADMPKLGNDALLKTEEDVLTEDFCRLGEDRLVRGLVEIPLLGLETPLSIGVWSSLSIQNFDRYVATFDEGNQSSLGPMTSWLCNPVPGDARFPDPVWLEPRDGRIRPAIKFAEDTHPLWAAQRDGLGYDDLAKLLRTYGHDIMSMN